jgi:hypothetical protein
VEKYRLLITPRDVSALGCWEGVTGEFNQVVGYTFFGDFFLRDPVSGDYALLFTLQPELMPMAFSDVAGFKSFLSDAGIGEHLLKTARLSDLIKLLGPPGQDQIYVPEPYPFLGGDESLQSYALRDVWVFASLVGRLQGIGDHEHGDDNADLIG